VQLLLSRDLAREIIKKQVGRTPGIRSGAEGFSPLKSLAGRCSESGRDPLSLTPGRARADAYFDRFTALRRG